MTTVWRLYHGNIGPLIEVVPDEHWPGMWRIRTRDGRLSDMVNLARARDAGRMVARSENPTLGDVSRYRWKRAEVGGVGPQPRPIELQAAE